MNSALKIHRCCRKRGLRWRRSDVILSKPCLAMRASGLRSDSPPGGAGRALLRQSHSPSQSRPAHGHSGGLLVFGIISVSREDTSGGLPRYRANGRRRANRACIYFFSSPTRGWKVLGVPQKNATNRDWREWKGGGVSLLL